MSYLHIKQSKEIYEGIIITKYSFTKFGQLLFYYDLIEYTQKHKHKRKTSISKYSWKELFEKFKIYLLNRHDFKNDQIWFMKNYIEFPFPMKGMNNLRTLDDGDNDNCGMDKLIMVSEFLMGVWDWFVDVKVENEEKGKWKMEMDERTKKRNEREEKRRKEEEKKIVNLQMHCERIPYHIRLEITRKYLFIKVERYVKLKHSYRLKEFYGYFNFDKSRKLFLIFHSFLFERCSVDKFFDGTPRFITNLIFVDCDKFNENFIEKYGKAWLTKRCSKLEKLEFKQLCLDYHIMKDLSNSSLKELTIGIDTSFDSQLVKILNNMSNLTSLNIKNYYIAYEPMEKDSNIPELEMKNIEKLCLSFVDGSDDFLSSCITFTKLKKLKKLVLKNVGLSYNQILCISNSIETIRSVRLKGCCFHDVNTYNILFQSRYIEKLDLKENGTFDQFKRSIGVMGGFFLNDKQLLDSIQININESCKIKELILSGGNISESLLEILFKIKTLVKLYFRADGGYYDSNNTIQDKIIRNNDNSFDHCVIITIEIPVDDEDDFEIELRKITSDIIRKVKEKNISLEFQKRIF